MMSLLARLDPLAHRLPRQDSNQAGTGDWRTVRPIRDEKSVPFHCDCYGAMWASRFVLVLVILAFKHESGPFFAPVET